MRRSFFAVLALGVAIFCTSCGSGSSSGGGGGSTTFVPGKWTVSLFANSGQLFGPTAELDMNLAQSGGAISSDSENSVDDATCGGAHMDSSSGTTSGDNFKLVFTIDSEKITLNGKLDPGGKTISVPGGTFSSSGGACLDGQGGVFTAAFIPSITGTSTGFFNGVPGTGVTAMLNEDPNFNVSGSMAVTGDPCFSSIAIPVDNLGVSVGSLIFFEMSDGTNVINFTGQVIGSAPVEYNLDVNVVTGCTEQFGVMQLTVGGEAPGAIPASAAEGAKSAAAREKPLMVERMKALLVERHAGVN
jgi:hypothetical protein